MCVYNVCVYVYLITAMRRIGAMKKRPKQLSIASSPSTFGLDDEMDTFLTFWSSHDFNFFVVFFCCNIFVFSPVMSQCAPFWPLSYPSSPTLEELYRKALIVQAPHHIRVTAAAVFIMQAVLVTAQCLSARESCQEYALETMSILFMALALGLICSTLHGPLQRILKAHALRNVTDGGHWLLYIASMATYLSMGLVLAWYFRQHLNLSSTVTSQSAQSNRMPPVGEGPADKRSMYHEMLLITVLTFTTLVSQLSHLLFWHVVASVAPMNMLCILLLWVYGLDHSKCILVALSLLINIAIWFQREKMHREEWRLLATVSDWTAYHNLRGQGSLDRV